MWVCKQCNKKLSSPSRSCSACNGETGIPSNVAIAGEDSPNLRARLQDCYQRWSQIPHASKRIEAFRQILDEHALVAINIRPETLVSMLADERVRYVNLHDNRCINAVIDYPKEVATKRKIIDLAIFGSEGEELAFGALSLGGIGLYSYGAACIFLKTEEIKNAVSFLEKNSFSFASVDHPSVHIRVPTGCRALISNVADLAVIKHASDVAGRPTLTKSEAAAVLIVSSGDKKTDDFIEAQVHSAVTMRTVSKILYAPHLDKPPKSDRSLVKYSKNSRELLAHYLEKADRTKIAVKIMEEPKKV